MPAAKNQQKKFCNYLTEHIVQGENLFFSHVEFALEEIQHFPPGQGWFREHKGVTSVWCCWTVFPPMKEGYFGLWHYNAGKTRSKQAFLTGKLTIFKSGSWTEISEESARWVKLVHRYA